MEHIPSDVPAHPRSISLSKVRSNHLNNEVIHTQPGTLVFASERLVEDLPELQDFAHIDIDGEVVVGSIVFGLGPVRREQITRLVRQRNVGVNIILPFGPVPSTLARGIAC